METFSALLAIGAGNSPVTDKVPAQRPVTRSFDIFFDLRLNKRLSKQSWGWWFETPSGPLWCHCNDGYRNPYYKFDCLTPVVKSIYQWDGVFSGNRGHGMYADKYANGSLSVVFCCDLKLVYHTGLTTHYIKWNHFLRYWPFVREIPVAGAFPSHRPVTRSFLCFLWRAPEQTVQQTIETHVIWDAMGLIVTSL